jgi:hypothetical protein
MALEVRQGRIESGKSIARVALRGALMEQIENARRLQARDLDRLPQDQVHTLGAAAPAWEQTVSLLRSVDLPAELSVYLQWIIGDTSRVWSGVLRQVGELPDIASAVALKTDWSLVLERVQIVGALCAAELGRRGHRADGLVADKAVWMLPAFWPEGRAGTQLTEQTYLQAPRFPSDKAYVTASPAARDAHAASILAGKQEKLAAASDAIGRRLGM